MRRASLRRALAPLAALALFATVALPAPPVLASRQWRFGGPDRDYRRSTTSTQEVAEGDGGG